MGEVTRDIGRRIENVPVDHPYNDNYLGHACPTIGSLFEIGLLTMDPDRFTKLFLQSRIPVAWENGNPAYLAGRSGAELYMEITGQEGKGITYREAPAAEYWCGYVYCYAQWHFGCSFRELLSAMPVTELLQLYHPLHEADISKVMQRIEECFRRE